MKKINTRRKYLNMEGNLGAAFQLYLNSLNNAALTSFDEWLKQNYYFTNMQEVNLPSSSSLQTGRAVSGPTYYTIPGTLIETRYIQENRNTQPETNELSAPEGKEKRTLVLITNQDIS